MISKDFFIALDELEKQKKIKKETFISALEAALTAAYNKNYGEAKNSAVKLDPEKNKIFIYSYKNVVEEVDDPNKEISVEDAKKIKKSYELGDKVIEEEKTKNFGRIAAQTAKQVINQKIKEAERSNILEEISEKEDKLITGIVKRKDATNVYVEIVGTTIEAIMSNKDQIPGENYEMNSRIKVYVKKIKEGYKSVLVEVSRSSILFIRRLFELEVPEIENGDIEIINIVREPGKRTKIAVHSDNPNIDVIGSCVGNKSMRIGNIINEANGEKIDIVKYSEDYKEYITAALSPATVLNVSIIGENESRVIVPDDKLSLAIGRKGENVRLAARLTGWKIDVKPESYLTDTSDFASTEDISEDIDNIDDMFE